MSTIPHARVGVLGIQGSVEEHMEVLEKLGHKAVTIKTKDDLDEVDGLIIPGGESTTIGKLLALYGLDREITKRASFLRTRGIKPLAVWGTCAGAILLAKEVLNRAPQHLSLMDIKIERNAYGRQLDSFETKIPVRGFEAKIPAVFIRAPRVRSTSPKVKVLAEYGGEPVMLRQEHLLATTFHPELTHDTRVHKYFISMTQTYAKRESKN